MDPDIRELITAGMKNHLADNRRIARKVSKKRDFLAVSFGFLALAICISLWATPAHAATATVTVSCNSPVYVGSTTNCTVTVTGTPTPTGTVGSFGTTGSGNFSPSQCTLSGGPGTASCGVSYTPTSVAGSPHMISAVYGGDSNYGQTSSSTSGSVTVNQAITNVGVSCAPNPVGVGSSTVCTGTVTGYQVASDTITFTQMGSGSGITSLVTSQAQCTLAPVSCQVTVMTSGAGGTIIGVSYPGDTNNQPSYNSVPFVISQAQSTLNVNCNPATLVVGEASTCTANVLGYSPTGTINWQTSGTGQFSPNPCTLAAGICTTTFTPTSAGTVTAQYAGDSNNIGSQGNFALTVNIKGVIQVSVANNGPIVNVTLSGCSVSPTTFPADGVPRTYQASSGCSGITMSLPPAKSTSQYLASTGGTTLAVGACSSSSCQATSALIYFQLYNTFQASPSSPSSWSSSGTISVTGTVLGSSGTSICGIVVSTGANRFSCQGWTDYDTPVVLGTLSVSTTQRWATAQSTFTETTGGNSVAADYYLQVLESFQYSVAGTSTAPAAPILTYSSFGSTGTAPLVGSVTSIWLDSGTSWSIPPALSGSSSTERWETAVTTGAASAGITASILYYHQFLVNFTFSVIGSGNAYTPPSSSYVAFGVAAKGTGGWVDAGSPYNYTDPLPGSGALERWFTTTPTGVVAASTKVSPSYYHQFAFVLNFSVSGGGTYSNPRLNYSSFGSVGLAQVNATKGTYWVDASTPWTVSQLLPSSSASERWITKLDTTGTATAPVTTNLLYYHQYLGTLSYSVNGEGGSPPVPRLNYTQFATPQQVPINTSPTYWMDSGSPWQVPLTIPGAHQERWLSNVTTSQVAGSAFKLDVQYTHQFYVEVGVSTAAGGSVGNIDDWHNQFSLVVLNETTAKLWNFAYWQGITSFSYNGTSLKPTLQVTGPANETAIFFPGLNISTDGAGGVAYSFGTIHGTVAPGTNVTVYPAPGKNISLTALPNTVDIQFDGWSGPDAGSLVSSNALDLQTSLSIASPGAVHAGFAVDYTDIRTFAIAAIGIFIAAAYVLIIRRGFTPKVPRVPLGRQ